MASCTRDQKAHALQWVEPTGMANKNAVLAMLVGLAKRIMKPVFDNFDGVAVLRDGSDT